MYQIIDTHTKAVVGTYSTFIRASRRRDRLDIAYGAYRYRVEAVRPLLRTYASVTT